MYSTLKINPIDEILVKSIEKINKYDRNNYKKYFNIIEAYIIDNNLIIGGNFANNLIEVDKIKTKDKFKLINYSIYEIYSEEPKEDAINLTNDIFNSDKNGLARYTYVFPSIPNNIYQIFINNRLICIFKKLPIYKGVQIEKLITSQLMPSLYKDVKFMCMGNYIQLINLYNDINNPNNADNWKKYITLEKKIRNLYISNEISNERSNEHDKKLILGQTLLLAQDIVQKYDLTFIYTYISNSNRIIIGDIGIHLLKNKNVHYNDIKKFRLQLLTTNKLEDDGKLLSIIGKKYNMDIQWTISTPKYIDDFYLKRLTATIMINGHKKPLLDIFNYGTYNLIAYNTTEIRGIGDKKNIKYASIFILMRFRLIDEWIFNLLLELKSIPEDYAKNMIRQTQNGFLALSKYMDKHLNNESDIISYINNLEYIGIYKDINLELKRKSAYLKQSFSIYYALAPDKYKLI